MYRSALIVTLSSNSKSTSTKPKSNRKRKAEKEDKPKMPFLKRARFLPTFFERQTWSLPNSIIYYILKNPSNSKVYQKLIQTCKYFFAKNPILVIDELECENKKWIATLNENQKYIDFTNVSHKFWITDELNGFFAKSSVSSIIPKLYKCDVKDLSLKDDIIFYEDFLLLSSNVRKIDLLRNIVKNKDGKIVPLEKLIESLPKVKKIFFDDNVDYSSITPKTAKKLLEIPHFSKTVKFDLHSIPEIFDIETFYIYLKKNKLTTFYLEFQSGISEIYKNRLEAIIDEIVETEEHDYKIPNIFFYGINKEKRRMLKSIFKSL